MDIQWSADGQWWWDGQKWQSAAHLHRQAESLEAVHSRSLLNFGAYACLGLAVSSYLILFLLTPLFVLVPFTSIISIALGRAARHSLPKTATRERRIASIGMILAALPLALIILSVIVLQMVLGFVMVTGHHSFG